MDIQIAKLIETMYEVDQGVRFKAAAEQEKTGEIGVYNYLTYMIDLLHHQKLKEFVGKDELEKVDNLDAEIKQKLWLLVQHQDLDVDLQKEYLEYVHFAPKNFAHLTDRVLINEGKPQRYGTQYVTDEQGNRSLAPMEDPDNLQKHRKAIGWMDSNEKD